MDWLIGSLGTSEPESWDLGMGNMKVLFAQRGWVDRSCGARGADRSPKPGLLRQPGAYFAGISRLIAYWSDGILFTF